MAEEEVSYWYLLTGEEWPVRAPVPFSTAVPVCEGDIVELTIRSDVAVHIVRFRVIDIMHCQTVFKDGPVDSGCHLWCRVEFHSAYNPEECCKHHQELDVTEYYLQESPPRPPPRGPRRPPLRLVK